MNQLVQQGSTSLTFDGNGNLISDGSTTYVYDAENKLISAMGAKNATLEYDPLGRLSAVTSGGAKRRLLYDGLDLVVEYDAAGTLLRRYMHAGLDDPVMWDEGNAMDCSGSRFFHTDERGSIAALADCYGNPASGNVGRFGDTGQTWFPSRGCGITRQGCTIPSSGGSCNRTAWDIRMGSISTVMSAATRLTSLMKKALVAVSVMPKKSDIATHCASSRSFLRTLFKRMGCEGFANSQ